MINSKIYVNNYFWVNINLTLNSEFFEPIIDSLMVFTSDKWQTSSSVEVDRAWR